MKPLFIVFHTRDIDAAVKRDDIAYSAKSLRARLRRIEERYISASSIWWDPLILNCWDNKLVEKFLNLNPRPTVEELRHVLEKNADY